MTGGPHRVPQLLSEKLSIQDASLPAMQYESTTSIKVATTDDFHYKWKPLCAYYFLLQ